MFLTLILSSFLTFMELNCENLFDTRHDSLKNDLEFLPDGSYRWTPYRYWAKLNHLGQEIVAQSNPIPDFVAMCEVENDSVMFDLTRRSLLRNAGYEYVMTSSPDERGIDVALLYQPASFALLHSHQALARYPSYERHSLCFWADDYGRHPACLCGSCAEP